MLVLTLTYWQWLLGAVSGRTMAVSKLSGKNAIISECGQPWVWRKWWPECWMLYTLVEWADWQQGPLFSCSSSSSILPVCSLILLPKFFHLALLHSVGLWYFHAHFKIFLTAYICLCIYAYPPICYTHVSVYLCVHIWKYMHQYVYTCHIKSTCTHTHNQFNLTSCK